jgi:hypothetical protein
LRISGLTIHQTRIFSQFRRRGKRAFPFRSKSISGWNDATNIRLKKKKETERNSYTKK